MTQRPTHAPIRVHLTFELPASLGVHAESLCGPEILLHSQATPPSATTSSGTSTSVPLDVTAATHQSIELSHTEDFSRIVWYGEPFDLSPAQRRVVAHLWAAMERGSPAVSVDTLLQVSELNATRLEAVFRNSKAWGIVVVRGFSRGYPPNSFMLNKFRSNKID